MQHTGESENSRYHIYTDTAYLWRTLGLGLEKHRHATPQQTICALDAERERSAGRRLMHSSQEQVRLCERTQNAAFESGQPRVCEMDVDLTAKLLHVA